MIHSQLYVTDFRQQNNPPETTEKTTQRQTRWWFQRFFCFHPNLTVGNGRQFDFFSAYFWTKGIGGFKRQREKNTPQDPVKLPWNLGPILFEVFTWIYFFLAQFVFGGAVGLFGQRIGYKLERMFGMLCLCLGLYVFIYIYIIYFLHILLLQLYMDLGLHIYVHVYSIDLYLLYISLCCTCLLNRHKRYCIVCVCIYVFLKFPDSFAG